MTSTLPRPKLPRGPAAPPPRLEESFPNSTKVYIDGPAGVQVPMREISLSGGEPPLRVYDTSGPQGVDVRGGLPSVRGEWIAARPVIDAESLRGGKAPEAIQRVTRPQRPDCFARGACPERSRRASSQ